MTKNELYKSISDFDVSVKLLESEIWDKTTEIVRKIIEYVALEHNVYIKYETSMGAYTVTIKDKYRKVYSDLDSKVLPNWVKDILEEIEQLLYKPEVDWEYVVATKTIVVDRRTK